MSDKLGTYSSPPDSHIRCLLHILHTYLPFSLPLYRRLQFHLAHPNTPSAQTFDSFPPTHPVSKKRLSGEEWLDIASRQEDGKDQVPWLAAHLDLSRAGETQVWIFANWEVPHVGTENEAASAANVDARRALLQSLFETIYNKHVPQISKEPPASWSRIKKMSANEGRPFSRSQILIGTCHSNVHALIPPEAITRAGDWYLKYIFPEECYSLPAIGSGLPPGFSFGPLAPSHLKLVQDRTHIPRGLETLSILPNVGLFNADTPANSDPVGWAFLGVDASLTSLHTESEHRGKNLATLITRELFRRQNYSESFRSKAENLEEEQHSGVNWAHADVGDYNTGSRRVMEKIGGKPEWEVCWVQLELEKLVGRGGVWRRVSDPGSSG